MGVNAARRLITLTCEICGKKFEARARRKSVHCRECAEDLRRKGLGPVQVKRKTSATPPYSNVQAKEVCWKQAEKDLGYYLEKFKRFQAYDGVTPSDLDRITDEDRRLANKIAARLSAKIWAQITATDKSMAEIGDWDLLNMTDLKWQSRKGVVHNVLIPLLIHPGIGVARLTKALHRKRPKLIPICDSVVENALGVCAGNKADRIIACMDRFRIIGRKHISRLQDLQELSKQLQAEMTELRILELLYWVQFGPFPPASPKD
jgi:hypothetical protein